MKLTSSHSIFRYRYQGGKGSGWPGCPLHRPLAQVVTSVRLLGEMHSADLGLLKRLHLLLGNDRKESHIMLSCLLGREAPRRRLRYYL